MKSIPLPPEFFAKNRLKLCNHMVPGSMAVICSSYQMPRNGDQYYPYRQQSDFFYLTGINQEESVFILCPDHPDMKLRELLFILKPNPKIELWFGHKLSLEEASKLSGIGQVVWKEEMDGLLGDLVQFADRIFFNLPEGSNYQSKVKPFDWEVHKKITTRYPGHLVSRLSPIMTRLRMVKEHMEVQEIRKACNITRGAFQRILGMMKPGIMEYEVEAEITHEFLRLGAEGHAYDPIIASGRNALILHYVNNNQRCKKGDLLLMDFGAEVNNYAADCSRTIPVSGEFSARQREIYEATLRVFRSAFTLMGTGKKMSDFHEEVGKIWQEEHIRLGLYSKRDTELHTDSEPLWKKYYMHGTSHSVGLDVHDPLDRTVPFQSGMILSCEPAIYIPEEGVGCRLENEIWITENGPVDLMEEIPLEPDEIERLLQSDR